jgi:hypothetical protein
MNLEHLRSEQSSVLELRAIQLECPVSYDALLAYVDNHRSAVLREVVTHWDTEMYYPEVTDALLESLSMALSWSPEVALLVPRLCARTPLGAPATVHYAHARLLLQLDEVPDPHPLIQHERRMRAAYVQNDLTRFLDHSAHDDRLTNLVDISNFRWLQPNEHLHFAGYDNERVIRVVKMMVALNHSVEGPRRKETVIRLLMGILAENMYFLVRHTEFSGVVVKKLEEFGLCGLTWAPAFLAAIRLSWPGRFLSPELPPAMMSSRQSGIPEQSSARTGDVPSVSSPPEAPEVPPPKQNMSGYKGFLQLENGKLACLDYEFFIGQKHLHEGPVAVGEAGFHYVTELHHVFRYYPPGPMHVYGRVTDVGTVRETDPDDSKVATNALVVNGLLEGQVPSSTCIYYFSAGRLSRTDGPAVIRSNGTRYHFLNGQLHRDDGPAIYNRPTGRDSWYVNGVKTQDRLADGTIIYYDSDDGPVHTSSPRIKRYYRHGQLYREAGPAVICECGLELAVRIVVNEQPPNCRWYVTRTRYVYDVLRAGDPACKEDHSPDYQIQDYHDLAEIEDDN